MSRTITYNIQSVELYTSPINNLEKVVKGCTFIAEIVEELDNGDGTFSTFSTSNGGSADFNPPVPEMFIPYESLTKETILGWVWEKVDQNNFETQLNIRLNLTKQPPATVSVPFN